MNNSVNTAQTSTYGFDNTNVIDNQFNWWI